MKFSQEQFRNRVNELFARRNLYRRKPKSCHDICIRIGCSNCPIRNRGKSFENNLKELFVIPERKLKLKKLLQ